MNTKRITLVLMLLTLSFGLFTFSSTTQAQGCSIQSFTMTPHPDEGVVLGTHVFLQGSSNCGTVRFTINGQPRAETAGGNQTENMKTEEFGTGTFEICFVGRSDSGWENAARNCKTLYVYRSQGPPSGSPVTGRCWITQFTVSPSVVQVGTPVNVAAAGQCDGNARAIRLLVGGHEVYQLGANSLSYVWETSGRIIESYEFCVTITSGEWRDEARSCVWVTLTDYPQPPAPPVQGPPSNNTEGTGTGLCRMTQFTVSSSRVQVGTPLQVVGAGQCDGNAPSRIRYLVGGHEVQVFEGNSFSTVWETAGRIAEPYEFCATITAGEWRDEGRMCTTVTLTTDAQTPAPPAQGTPSSPPGSGGGGEGSSPSSNTCPNLPARLVVGQRGRNIVDGRGNTNVRGNPGGSVLFSITEGEEFDVIGGPICLTADSSNLIRWFEINIAGRGTGWAAEAINTGYVLEPVNGSSPSGEGTPNSGNPSQICSGNLSRLDVGMTAMVNDATPDPVNVRSGPGINFGRIDQLEVRSEVSIVAGPECADGWIWWFVQYSNTSGWIAEVDSRGLYNLVPVSGGAGNANAIENVTVNLEKGLQFTFQFDRNRFWIMNGSEYVVFQINQLLSRMDGKSLGEKQLVFVRFAFPTVGFTFGESDINIQHIQSALCGSAENCKSRLLYMVGDRAMDLSGLGNIAFGYFMTDFGWSIYIQNFAANADQYVRDNFALNFHRFTDDFDDIRQREVGMSLSNGRLSVEALEGIADLLQLH